MPEQMAPARGPLVRWTPRQPLRASRGKRHGRVRRDDALHHVRQIRRSDFGRAESMSCWTSGFSLQIAGREPTGRALILSHRGGAFSAKRVKLLPAKRKSETPADYPSGQASLDIFLSGVNLKYRYYRGNFGTSRSIGGGSCGCGIARCGRTLVNLLVEDGQT